jgi:hypothetical protein
MGTIDISLVAGILGIGGSIYAIAHSYTQKDLANYKALDKVRDDLLLTLNVTRRQIDRIENDLEHHREVSRLKNDSFTNRLNRHRREINEVRGYLSKHHQFDPRETNSDTGIF